MTTDVAPLVAGKPAVRLTKTATIRVLRSFSYAGKATEVGATIGDVPLLTALELVQMAKAELVTERAADPVVDTVSAEESTPTETRPRRGRPPKTEE